MALVVMWLLNSWPPTSEFQHATDLVDFLLVWLPLDQSLSYYSSSKNCPNVWPFCNV